MLNSDVLYVEALNKKEQSLVIVQNEGMLWEEIQTMMKLDGYGKVKNIFSLPSNIESFMLKNCETGKSAHLVGIKSDDDLSALLDNKFVQEFLKDVTEVDIDGMSSHVLKLLSLCPNVHTLELSLNEFSDEPKSEPILFSYLQRLKVRYTADFIDESIIDYIDGPAITTLVLRDVPLTTTGLEMVFRPLLRHVDIKGYSHRDVGTILTRMAETDCSLYTLRLCEVNIPAECNSDPLTDLKCLTMVKMGSRDLSLLLRRCPEALEELEIRDPELFFSETVVAGELLLLSIPLFFSQLKELRLPGLKPFSETFLHRIAAEWRYYQRQPLDRFVINNKCKIAKEGYKPSEKVKKDEQLFTKCVEVEGE